MSERHYKRISACLVLIVTILVCAQLLWEHFNGGIVSHHLLNDPDLPAISNGWGLVILPLLAWVAAIRIRKRSDVQAHKGGIPKSVLAGFFGMLLASLLQSIAFQTGYESITMYLALGVVVTGLILPIYRAECILGYVLGSAFTFGAVIPILGISVIATISLLSNVCLKPFLLSLWGRLVRLRYSK